MRIFQLSIRRKDVVAIITTGKSGTCPSHSGDFPCTRCNLEDTRINGTARDVDIS